MSAVTDFTDSEKELKKYIQIPTKKHMEECIQIQQKIREKIFYFATDHVEIQTEKLKRTLSQTEQKLKSCEEQKRNIQESKDHEKKQKEQLQKTLFQTKQKLKLCEEKKTDGPLPETTNSNNELQQLYKELFYKNLQEDLKNCLK